MSGDEIQMIRKAIDEAQGADLDAGCSPKYTRDLYDQRVTALHTLAAALQRAENALAEIEAKPFRAEEVTARYRRETR